MMVVERYVGLHIARIITDYFICRINLYNEDLKNSFTNIISKNLEHSTNHEGLWMSV